MSPLPASAVPEAHTLRRLQQDDIGWALLRAENAPVIAAILGRHLAADDRQLDVDQVHGLVETDILALRADGVVLPRTAIEYCAQWRADGYLVRRPAVRGPGETFELSPGALGAVRYLRELHSPRRTVSESRLTTIADQLGDLAHDTDPDIENRLAQLRADRDRLDARIHALESGEAPPVDERRARDRVAEILDLASSLPEDFARVRADIEDLNRSLREEIVSSDDESGSSVLDRIFTGVDVLADSDAGRSFSGFYALILNPELGAAFEDSVARVLERDFASGLDAEQRSALRGLFRTLMTRSEEVNRVMSTLVRGLHRFVSDQEYQAEREIKQEIRAALQDAVRVAALNPGRTPIVTLARSAVELRSLGALVPHNPGERRVGAALTVNAAPTVDLDSLRAMSLDTEIDVHGLERAVNAVIAQGPATIAAVLDAHPATQGVASVLGLLILALDQGTAGEGTETVRWSTEAGERQTRIPRFTFTTEVRAS